MPPAYTPSPAACHDVLANGMKWSLDTREYPDDFSGERTFETALYTQAVGASWLLQRGFVITPLVTPGTVAIPGEAVQNMNFQDLWTKYGSDWNAFIARLIPTVNSILATLAGTPAPGPTPPPDTGLDAQATAARQAIAAAINTYKPGPDHASIVPK